MRSGHRQLKLAIAALTVMTAAHGAAASGNIAVSGRPVPELDFLDDVITIFMADNTINTGIVGIMKDGRVVYLKGFGDFFGEPCPENAHTRIASVTKPVTAAAVRQLIARGDFALNDKVFDVGQSGGGLLNHAPWPALGDSRIDDITVEHCLRHRGGWDRGESGDYTYMERAIAGDMNVTSPPGRVNTIRWILGKPLDFAPGSETKYSNIGYLALGLVVEQYTGQSLVSYLRSNVLTSGMWVPSSELQLGRTFREWQGGREIWYDEPLPVPNVFDTFGLPVVLNPYGGWDHEARVGQGALVVSAPTLLEFANRYHVGIGSDIGKPIDATNPLDNDESHNGALGGLNTLLWQRTDGVNVFISFNSRPAGGGHFGESLKTILDPILDGMTITTTQTSDGFWVNTSGVTDDGYGGYHHEYESVGYALDQVGWGSKIRLKPGSSSWTGVMGRRMLIDAPLGTATIGQ